MLTIEEVSKFLGECVPIMIRWEKEGEITTYRTTGRHKRYDKNNLIKFECKNDVKIEVINRTESKIYEEELVQDVLPTIIVFSSKLYGSKSHKFEKNKKYKYSNV